MSVRLLLRHTPLQHASEAGEGHHGTDIGIATTVWTAEAGAVQPAGGQCATAT
jgi:hypothetical protein